MELYMALDKQEWEQLVALPIYIALLIAGADGTIDSAEIKRAIDFSKSATSLSDQEIINFYCDVHQDFEDKLKVVAANLPVDREEREELLIDRIKNVNMILTKIEKPHACALYASFKRMAKKIATASGGILGWGSVGKEESRLLDLQMLDNPSV